MSERNNVNGVNVFKFEGGIFLYASIMKVLCIMDYLIWGFPHSLPIQNLNKKSGSVTEKNKINRYKIIRG